MKKLQQALTITLATIIFAACKKDSDPIIIVPPSSGSQVELNGIISNEDGSAAGYSV